MPVVPLSPPRSTELITLATAKARLRIDDTSEDGALSFEIATASALVVERCKFPLARMRYRETRRGDGRRELYLSRLPVEAESLTLSVSGQDITDWSLLEAEYGLVFRSNGWPEASREPNIVARYTAGYLLSGDISTWNAERTYEAGWFVRPTSPAMLRFECTSAGTSGTSEPTWPEIAGGAVADGSVVWTARSATEGPQLFQDWAYGALLTARARRDLPGGVASIQADGMNVSFFASQTATALPPSIEASIDSWAAGRGGVPSW